MLVSHSNVKLHLCMSCAYEAKDDLVDYPREDIPDGVEIVCGSGSMTTQVSGCEPVEHIIELESNACDQLAKYIYELPTDA